MTPVRDSETVARFIVLEGIDGAGKSSQMESLTGWLADRGCRVATCRDPGSTAAGDAIRAILLDRRDLDLGMTTEMLLYMAARAQLVTELIRPSLARGEWVVSDRFLLANVVYQGHAGGLDADVIRQIGAVATGGLEPDLVLVLDIDPEAAGRRLSRPLDKLESRGDDFRRRLRAGYLAEAARRPDRIAVIDADHTVADVQAALRAALADRFPELR